MKIKHPVAAAWITLGTLSLVGTAYRLATSPYCPTYDDAWYLENSFRFFYGLKEGIISFGRIYIDSFRIKAPLISVLPLPIYAVFGPSESAAIWVNLLAVILASWGIYLLGRRLFSEDAACCAVAIYLCSPLTFGLSRLFFVETILTALVVWTFVLSQEDRQDGTGLGILSGLGLLAKSLFLVYVVVPIFIERRRLYPHAKRAFFVAVLIAATWYAFNLPYVIGFGLSAGFGPIARDYAPGAALAPSVLLGYAVSLLRDGLSWPLAVAGIATLFIAPSLEKRPRALLLAWSAPLALFFVGVNKDIRYAAPLIPAFALAVGAAWARLKGAPRVVSGLTLAAAALFAYGPRTKGPYNAPASACVWDRGALIDALDRTATAASTVAIALEHSEMNANSVASLAAARGRSWKTTSLGYAQSSVEGALIRLKDKNADHLVLFEGAQDAELAGFLNRANAGVASAVASGHLKSVETARVAVAPGVSAHVLRLTR